MSGRTFHPQRRFLFHCDVSAARRAEESRTALRDVRLECVSRLFPDGKNADARYRPDASTIALAERLQLAIHSKGFKGPRA